MIILLTDGLIKKTVQMGEYFLKLRSLGANVKVELDLCNYTTKVDLKLQQVLIHPILLKRLI